MTHVFDDIIIDFPDWGTMLDVGCNDGYFMRHFEWCFDSYVGCDMFSIQSYLGINEVDEYSKKWEE